MNELLAFSGALFLMVITPGPGVLACVSKALTSGFKMAAFVTLGIISGDIIFVLMALYGLSAIAELMSGFFTIIRFLGAIYLFWLGYRTWTSGSTIRMLKCRESTSFLACYMNGLTITLGNPKAIAFYLSIFPAFLDISRLSTSDVVIILVIVVAVLTAVLFTYSLGASRVRVMFDSRRYINLINRCSGGAMIIAGTGIVADEIL